MRNNIAVALVLLALPAFAQSADRPRRVSVFLSGFSMSYAEGAGTDISGGVGVALEYRWSRAWSGEVSVASEEHHETITIIDPAAVTVSRIDVRAYPIDAVVRYQFQGMRSPWRPYVGGGARFVPSPESQFGTDYESRLSAQAVAGVDFTASEVWSVRFDVKRLLRGDSAVYDDVNKVSVGVGWRF